MEFQEVTELVPGTKYRIVYSNFLTFRGVYSHTEEVHIFKNVHGYGFCDEKPFAFFNKFYEPILGRIQQTMEERALQLILKNIIGDETFQW
jgi:hypothetical protein